MREPAARLGALRALGTVVIAFLGAQLAGAVVGGIAAPGFSRAALADASTELLTRALVPSMLASELTLLAIALAAPLTAALSLRGALGLHGAPPQVFLAASVGTVLLGPVGDTLMTALSEQFPGLGFGSVETLHDVARRLPILLLWPTFALLPGLAEELLFRGVLQRALPRGAVAVLVSGVVFALFHVDPIHVIGVLPLGLFLAWVAQRSSTLVTIVAHVGNNSIALLALRTDALDVGYATPHELPLSWVAASLAGALGCGVLVARSTRQTVG